MIADEFEQRTHGDHGEDERGDKAHGKDRQIRRLEQITVLVARVESCRDHGRHGQEKGKLGRGLARQAEQQASDNGSAGARGAGDQRQALAAPHLQRMLPTHGIDRVGGDRVHPALGPEDDHPTDHQCRRDSDRVEQVLVDLLGKQ